MVKSVVLLASIAATSGQVVTLKDGPVQGTSAGGVSMWLGIPFAAPPVGDLRWRPPQAPTPWGPEVLDATHYRADCIAASQCGFNGTDPKPNTTEDCLFVNVFAPAEKPASPKPVFLFIHGGGFNCGGSSIFPGANLTAFANGELLIVTFNYRLAVFGFAAGEQLRGRDPEGGTGNYGILDQRFAMEWTKTNIGAFGGDPDRVLIVGESAGGSSVANHLVRPKSWGLFSAAGVMSGAFYSNQKYLPGTKKIGPTPTNITVAQQEPHLQALFASADCGDVDCMLKLSQEELVKAMLVASPDQPWIWEPTIDGVDLVATGVSLAAAGQLAPVPVVIGSNMEDEGPSVPNCEPGSCTEADFRKMVASWTGFGKEDVEQAVQAYHEEVERAIGDGWDKWYAASKHFGSDLMMTCPSRRLARWVTQAGQDAYWYYWAHMPKLADGSNQPASHGSELNFLFMMLQKPQPSEVGISKAFRQYWVDFAVKNFPDYPAYKPDTDAAIVFGMAEHQTVELVPHHRHLMCHFWDVHPEHWNSDESLPVVV